MVMISMQVKVKDFEKPKPRRDGRPTNQRRQAHAELIIEEHLMGYSNLTPLFALPPWHCIALWMHLNVHFA